MKTKWILLLATCVIAVLTILSGCKKQDEFPVIEGPYLGQKPPGMTAEIFAPDGKYLFFSSGRSRHPNYSEEAITLNQKLDMMNSWGNGRNEDIYWIDAGIIDALRSK